MHDGAPAESVYRTDLREEYFDFGYKLFRDETVIPKSHFIAADILDQNDGGLKELEGKLDVLSATHLIHVFSIEDQKVLLKRFIGLLKSERGVMITERATGHLEAGYHELSNATCTTKGGGGNI